jgi:hypothetical protein
VIAADFCVAAGVAEIDVEKAVIGKVRIEGEAEKTALAVRRDLAGHIEERRCKDLSRGKIEDFDLPSFLDDEQATRIAGRRAREQRLGEARCYPGREDCAGLALRSVRVVPVDEIRPRRPLECVAAVVADDEVDVRHKNPCPESSWWLNPHLPEEWGSA